MNPLAYLLLAITPQVDAPAPAFDAARCEPTLVTLERQLLGFGADYDVAFDELGVCFAPRVQAGTVVPLTLTLESVRLGEEVFARPAARRAPSGAGRVVEYRLDEGEDWGVERYTLLPNGLKQDVVLERLPAAKGELVVRWKVTGGRRGAAAGDALLFEAGDGTRVRVSDVVGVDADGRRAPGRLTLDGDTIECRLPADFVASAALPLTVDPVIASYLHYFSNTSGKSVSPDVAYSEFHDAYGIVWNRYSPLASPSNVIYMTLAAPTGQQAIETIVLGTSDYQLQAPPRIAPLQAGERFLVGWGAVLGGMYSGQVGIELRSVGSTGTYGELYVESSDVYLEPYLTSFDLGGSETDFTLMVLTKDHASLSSVHGTRVFLDEEGLLVVGDQEGETIELAPWHAETVHGNVTVSSGPDWIVAHETRSGPYSAIGVRRVTRVPHPSHDPVDRVETVGPAMGWFYDGVTEPRHPSVAGPLDPHEPIYALVAQRTDGVVNEVIADELTIEPGCSSVCSLHPYALPRVLESLPVSRDLHGPSVGASGFAGFTVVWTRENYDDWEVVGQHYPHGTSPFLITNSLWGTAPRISDWPDASPAGLAVWAGSLEENPYLYPQPETRGALLEGE